MANHTGFRSGHFDEGPGYTMERREGGREWLLIVSVEGAGFHRHGTRMTEIPRGNAMLYAPGAPQDYGTHPEHGRWELLWAHFTNEIRTAAKERWPQQNGCGVIELAGAFEPVVEAMGDVVDWQRGAAAGRHAFAANALERALLWCDTANPLHASAAIDPRVEAALRIMGSRLAEPLDVQTLADEAGISASRLSHLFKRDTGLSVPAYLESRRLERAEDLLRMTNRSVSDVALAVGYSDPLYFSRRFSRYSGTSPRDWRDRARAGVSD